MLRAAAAAGHLPFEGDMPGCCKGREALCAGMRPFGPQRLSPACTAFVSAMLARDPKQRPSARAAAGDHSLLHQSLGRAHVLCSPHW